MDSLDLSAFMRKSHYVDFTTGLRKLVYHINALAPQLPHGFGDDAHKKRFLRRAVMKHNWANTPISQIASARYSFGQFITALQESWNLQDEVSRASAPADPIINYSQYVSDSRNLSNREVAAAIRDWIHKPAGSEIASTALAHNHQVVMAAILDSTVQGIAGSTMGATVAHQDMQTESQGGSASVADPTNTFSVTASAHLFWIQSKRTLKTM